VGAQSSVGGGGRYDGLAEQLGGKHTPGVGFGTGLERLILNLREQGVEVADSTRPVVYVAHLSARARATAANFAREPRRLDVPTVLGVGSRSIRTRLRNADAAGVRCTAPFADDDVTNGTVSLRDMAASAPEIVPAAEGIRRIYSEASLSPADEGALPSGESAAGSLS